MESNNENRVVGIKRFSKVDDVSTLDPYYLVYTNLFKDLRYAVSKYASGFLLDIGCGNKPYEEFFINKIKSYIGCDIVQSSEEKVDIICEATSIPLPSNSFDTVFSTQTIEHVADHQMLIDEAFRLLRPDGYIIISGPMYWHLHEEPYDFFRFTRYGFEYVLEKSGFSVVEILSNGGKWALFGQTLIHCLYPDIHYVTSIRGRVLRKFFSLVGGIEFINKFFFNLDKRLYDENNTMNYVVIAQKKAS